jgi:hypothetical protein
MARATAQSSPKVAKILDGDLGIFYFCSFSPVSMEPIATLPIATLLGTALVGQAVTVARV